MKVEEFGVNSRRLLHMCQNLKDTQQFHKHEGMVRIAYAIIIHRSGKVTGMDRE